MFARGELTHICAHLREKGLRERLPHAFHGNSVHAGEAEQVGAHIEGRLVLAFGAGLDRGHLRQNIGAVPARLGGRRLLFERAVTFGNVRRGSVLEG